MSLSITSGWNKRRLRIGLILFFLALAIPTGILIQQAYSQLKWEAFHRYRVLAEELAGRIDRKISQLIDIEEARSFADYAFLVVKGDPRASFLQRSSLSNYPVRSDIPGLIGYFQVDANGVLSSPLLPETGVSTASYGISASELAQRQALQSRIQGILTSNRLVSADDAPSKPPASKPNLAVAAAASVPKSKVAKLGRRIRPDSIQRKLDTDATKESESVANEAEPSIAAFDRLNNPPQRQTKQAIAPTTLGKIEDLKLESRYFHANKDQSRLRNLSETKKQIKKRSKRKETIAVPQQQLADSVFFSADNATRSSNLRVQIFESELDTFQFNLLDSGHFVIFRKVWRDTQRYIQGALIDQRIFTRGLIEQAFRSTTLSQMSNLAIAYRGQILTAIGGRASRRYLSSTEDLRGTLLYQTALSAPLSDAELVFSINRLPAGPGGAVVFWVAAILSMILFGGFFLMYRLGLGQINLTRQQQDFVSAVSHELKTPLTSIRMYGEILREGWADEAKKKTYYEYIHDESERLSRLISNVLQLARMTRNELKVDLKPIRIGALIDGLRSKVSSQIERAGYKLSMNCDDSLNEVRLKVDVDWFTQILINLVDNAIKFSSRSETKRIKVSCTMAGNARIQFSVRDYGPGIPKEQMRKIFKLFYRTENELTRETVGTGIGLALVHQLAQAMGGKVDVVNQDPGAEFRLLFPIQKQSK